VAQHSNLDLAINALVLIRNAQRAIDAALRLPADDRAAVAEQVEAVRRSVGQVAGSLAATIPGAQSLAGAGQVAAGGLAQRSEFRALTGMVSFFARQGSEALGAVAGVAGSLGGSRDRSLVLAERITKRLREVGVATREDLARELDVDPRSADFQDALERTLGTGRAEWYGSGTYGLPREELDTMISKAREATEAAPPEPAEARPAAPPELGSAMDELNSSLDRLSGAVSARRDPGDRVGPAVDVDDLPADRPREVGEQE
jgi:hypothetical protein